MAGEKIDETEAPPEQQVAAAVKTPNPWIPVIAVILLVPGISFALTQFVLIPHIKNAVTETQTKAAGAEARSPDAVKGKAPDGKAAFSFEFPAVVVNLSGTMGTRYLKVTFTVFSSNPEVQKIMTDNKSQLLDVTLDVLSSRTLADLEMAGAMNMVGKDLVAHFNQALNSDVVSQVYFSEFVVQ